MRLLDFRYQVPFVCLRACEDSEEDQRVALGFANLDDVSRPLRAC